MHTGVQPRHIRPVPKQSLGGSAFLYLKPRPLLAPCPCHLAFSRLCHKWTGTHGTFESGFLRLAERPPCLGVSLLLAAVLPLWMCLDTHVFTSCTAGCLQFGAVVNKVTVGVCTQAFT